MNHQPSNSIILSTLKLDKEFFWKENTHLPPDQVQQQWAIRNAQLEQELSSVLGPTAPIQGHNLAPETVPSPGLQQVPLLPPALVAIKGVNSVWRSTQAENGPQRLTRA